MAVSYRREAFARIKPANQERVDAALADGRVQVLWGTVPVEVAPDRVTLRDADGRERSLPNDQLFVFIGGELPTPFLEACGVEIETRFGEA